MYYGCVDSRRSWLGSSQVEGPPICCQMVVWFLKCSRRRPKRGNADSVSRSVETDNETALGSGRRHEDLRTQRCTVPAMLLNHVAFSHIFVPGNAGKDRAILTRFVMTKIGSVVAGRDDPVKGVTSVGRNVSEVPFDRERTTRGT